MAIETRKAKYFFTYWVRTIGFLNFTRTLRNFPFEEISIPIAKVAGAVHSSAHTMNPLTKQTLRNIYRKTQKCIFVYFISLTGECLS